MPRLLTLIRFSRQLLTTWLSSVAANLLPNLSDHLSRQTNVLTHLLPQSVLSCLIPLPWLAHCSFAVRMASAKSLSLCWSVADLPSKWTSFTPAQPAKSSNERRTILFVIWRPNSNAYFKPKNAFEGTCFFKATLAGQNRLFHKNSYQNFFCIICSTGHL